MSAGLVSNLDLRKSGLGGTDASAVLGLNPWTTPLDVWLRKRGLANEQPQSEAMYWGQALEPVIADRYSRDTGKALWVPEQVFHHPSHDFLVATPDRLIVGEDAGLEIKTANAFSAREWGEPGTDRVPVQYLVQCVHYMAVVGLPVWHLAVLIGGSDYRVYTIHRDRNVESEIVGRLRRWWGRHMVEGEQPEIPGGKSADAWLRERFPREVLPELSESSIEAEEWAAELRESQRALKAAEARTEAAKNNLKALIGDAAGMRGNGWFATWKTSTNGKRPFLFKGEE